jgi:hypothetical protein
MIGELISGGLFGFLKKGLEVIFPDPQKKAEAEALLIKAQQEGKLLELGAEMQVMLAEARSKDKWTSRARPSFLYVIYIMILTAIPMGVVYAVNPTLADNITTGVKAWLDAIPKELWTLFGVGYLGYTGAREYGKKKIIETLERFGRRD